MLLGKNYKCIRFGLLALELVKWLNYGRHEEVKGKERIVESCVQAAALTLLNPHLSSALSLPSHNALVSSAAIAITGMSIFENI